MLPKHSFRQNTISLTAPLRFLPPPASGYPGSNFTQFANSSRFKAGLRQYKLSFGTFILAEWVTKKCSKSRFAKSSSGPFDWGLTKIVWATAPLMDDPYSRFPWLRLRLMGSPVYKIGQGFVHEHHPLKSLGIGANSWLSGQNLFFGPQVMVPLLQSSDRHSYFRTILSAATCSDSN